MILKRCIYAVLGIIFFYSSLVLLARENDSYDPSRIDLSSQAFTHPLPSLTNEQSSLFINGKTIFHGVSNDSRDLSQRGIGPDYNALTCASCHVNDNRGNPETSPSTMMFFYNPTTANNGDPTYGTQLQELSTSGISEGKVKRTKNKTSIETLNRGTLDKETTPYTRIAPSIAGAGLIEAIPTRFFVGHADPDDKNNDGISGRISYVSSRGQKTIGRFGWTASKSSVKDQTSHAAFEDIGLTNSLFLGNDIEPELGTTQEKNLIFYARNIAPPRRRALNDEARVGQQYFRTLSCAGCHTERIELESSDVTPQSKTVIYPFSDFLLHNMGKELADGAAMHNRDADEFRTAPLWGIGLMKTSTGSINLMHDGRATSIDQAIELHGGEAADSRLRFHTLTRSQKDAVIAYVNSL